MGTARRASSHGAWPPRPREESGSARPPGQSREEARLARRGRRGRERAADARPGRHADRGARAARAEQHSPPDQLRRFQGADGGQGRIRVRRLVRQLRLRSTDQGGDEGDDSRPAGRGIPVRRNADDLSQVRQKRRVRRANRGSAMGQGVLTTGFSRVDGVMCCEGVPLEHIVRDVGSPVYVYSAATIRDRYERLDRTLAPVSHRIHYTLKANASRGLLEVLRALGAGVDVVSGGELKRALAAGFKPADIIFGGVGKTERELADAIDADIHFINVESEAEIRIIDRLAAE